MVQKLIELSLRNRWLVLAITLGLFAWGILAVKQNPVDAIPDLSENQVIVFTEWMGRSPQIIEDQVTYPLVSNLQGIPKVKNIRRRSSGIRAEFWNPSSTEVTPWLPRASQAHLRAPRACRRRR